MKIEKTLGLKALGHGKALSEGQLSKINTYALVPLREEQVYVRKYLMAHNGIDRDNERFHEDMLEDFAQTLPGKGFFVEGHPSSWSGKGGPGEGRFYDASVEEMHPGQFKELTGEEIHLPDGVKKAKVLWGEAYLLKLESNSDTLAKIDGGIYSYVSIGFKAPVFDVTDERGNRKFGEYRPRGEAMEGSLVWLGAQPGASVMKNANANTNANANANTNANANVETHGRASLPRNHGTILEGRTMKEFLKKLSEKLGKAFSEEQAVDEIAFLFSEKDTKIKELEPHAADGRAYRKHLIDDLLKYGALIDEIPADAEAQKKEAEFLNGWPIDRIKATRDKYETRARIKFPDTFTFKAKDETDRRGMDKEGKRQQVTTGRKDYTSPAHNELFETVGK